MEKTAKYKTNETFLNPINVIVLVKMIVSSLKNNGSSFKIVFFSTNVNAAIE